MDQGEGRRRDQPVGRRDPRVRAQGAERQRPRVLPGLARGLPPGGVALGNLVVEKIPPQWASKNKFRLEKYSKKVLNLHRSQKSMLHKVQAENVISEAKQEQLSSTVKETTRQLEILAKSSDEKFSRMSDQISKLHEETQRMKNSYEEEFKKKEEEQSQMIAKLKEEHEKHAMALSRQTEEMAKRFEELKIEQSEQQMEFLQQHEENLKKLEERYLKEKMSLIQQKDAELAKLAEQESRWKHKATAEELRAREKELGQNKLRRKLKEEQDSKVERVLSMVRKHMEEDFKRREADLRNEVQETKEDSEYYSSLVNQMAAESRAAKDEVNDMKHHVIESWRNCCDVHWAFGEDLKPGSVVVKEVGELSNDEGFCKALEKHVLKKFGLPPGVRLRGELPEGLGNLESKFLDAQIHFAKEQSRLQKSYVEDGNFEPWTVSEKGYELNDNGMEELIKKCGREVADELRRVTLEIQKFNSSGRYPVFKLWNKAEGREATPTEVVEAMHARGEEMQERIEELEEVLREKTRPKKGNAMRTRSQRGRGRGRG
uniref:Factor of DNA methylation 1-5/IDN2 domain-containing protein n=1 Tax=Tetraselmis sp. GSL018 TaxID=582737 RepID=A0A061RPA8_9CHLO